MTKLRFEIREAFESDREFILDSWRKSWRKRSPLNEHFFTESVRKGVLSEPDTHFAVACAEYNPHRIWGWICWTPGLVPTVHYVLVRPADPWVEDGEPQALRGNGIAWALLATAGVTRELVYTMRPRPDSGLEALLLEAAKRRGVTAIYRDVSKEFLRMRRG